MFFSVEAGDRFLFDPRYGGRLDRDA